METKDYIKVFKKFLKLYNVVDEFKVFLEKKKKEWNVSTPITEIIEGYGAEYIIRLIAPISEGYQREPNNWDYLDYYWTEIIRAYELALQMKKKKNVKNVTIKMVHETTTTPVLV